MIKKYVSILMLYLALAILLGHNLIGHHHHDHGQSEEAHHTSAEFHHLNATDAECIDWEHFFSAFSHGANGLTFLISQGPVDDFSQDTFHFPLTPPPIFDFQAIANEAGQYLLHDPDIYYPPLQVPTSGLRAPPLSIV